ncbi:MAG: hypothetical protein WBD16_05995 [Pyrinomonadaceae bacterium]
MGRKILAVIVAMIVAVGIISIVQMGNSMVVMPPSQDVMNDAAKLRDYMTTLPITAYVVVIIGYVIASFAAGFIVTKMARQVSTGTTLPIVVGVLLTLAMVLNLVMLPGQPLWFAVLCLLSFIPLSLLGHRFAR